MAHACENSLESFRKAVKMGVDVLEMDVRISKDGVPMIMHDARVEGTTNGRGLVSDLDLDSLKDLRLKNKEQVPTLSEVLTEFSGKCEFIIEFKDDVGILKAFQVAVDAGVAKDVVFSSFDGTQLLSFKVKHPRARIAFLCKDKKLQMLNIAEKLKAEGLHIHRKVCNKALVEKAHGQALSVFVWTVNKPKEMTRFINMDVDGIITDKPDVLRDTIRGMKG